MAAFLGTWTCRGEVLESKFAKARKTRSRLSIRRDLGGHWYVGEAQEDKTRENPEPAARRFFWSFDAVLKKFVGGWLRDDGGWSGQTSPGWQNDAFTLLGHVTAAGNRLEAHDVFSRPRDGAFTRRYEILDYLTWIPVHTETCRKK
jgi:hypothetical protein